MSRTTSRSPLTTPLHLRRLFLALLFPALLTLPAPLAAGQAGAAVHANGAATLASLAGTWEFQVTFVNCDTGAPVAPTFTSLHTYFPGGSAIEQGSTVGPPPSASRTVGQGVWRRQAPGDFRARVTFFAFDNAGHQLTRVMIDEIVETEGTDEAISYGVGRVFTPTGIQVGSNCFTGPGRRVTLDE